MIEDNCAGAYDMNRTNPGTRGYKWDPVPIPQDDDKACKRFLTGRYGEVEGRRPHP